VAFSVYEREPQIAAVHFEAKRARRASFQVINREVAAGSPPRAARSSTRGPRRRGPEAGKLRYPDRDLPRLRSDAASLRTCRVPRSARRSVDPRPGGADREWGGGGGRPRASPASGRAGQSAWRPSGRAGNRGGGDSRVARRTRSGILLAPTPGIGAAR
jgi:hypothetical protein